MELALFVDNMEQEQGRYSPAHVESASRVSPGEETVADESNANFVRMYTGKVSVEDTIGLLRRLKGSSEQREQEFELIRHLGHIDPCTLQLHTRTAVPALHLGA